MTDNPMDRLATLGRLVKDKAAEIGLEMHAFLPVPDLSGGGVHMVQGMFILDAPVAEEVVEADDELGQELAGIMAATAEQDAERLREEQRRMDQEKADAARERMLAMREKLERGEGLFD